MHHMFSCFGDPSFPPLGWIASPPLSYPTSSRTQKHVTRHLFSCFGDPPLPLLGWKAGKRENVPMWDIFVFASYPAHPSHCTRVQLLPTLPAFHSTLAAPPSTPLHHNSKNMPGALGHIFQAWLPPTPPL